MAQTPWFDSRGHDRENVAPNIFEIQLITWSSRFLSGQLADEKQGFSIPLFGNPGFPPTGGVSK